jgi:hypothetical protein
MNNCIICRPSFELFFHFLSGTVEACVFVGCGSVSPGDWFHSHPVTRHEILEKRKLRRPNVH